MSSSSTKQRARRAKGAGAKAAATADAPAAKTREAEREAARAPEATDAAERFWTYASLAVLLLATLLRVYDLELKPMHHDEGVNGFFLTNLMRDGVYHYDPSNYHGPTLYYFALPFTLLLGLETFAVRLVPALCGVGTVALALCLRRHLGTVGALAAGALIAVSPGAVYQSRYFIHESPFVFFTVGAVVAAVWFYDTGQPKYLMLASASAALLFATKETAFISAGVVVLAALLAWAFVGLTRGQGRGAGSDEMRRGARANAGGFGGGRMGGGGAAGLWGDRARAVRLIAGAAALFLFVNVLFYSSFFTYAKGVEGALETFRLWRKTASKDHVKPFWTYLDWLRQEESALLVLAAAGAAVAVLRRRKNRFAVFAGAWAFGLFLAYSLIGYKTPWLMLSFTVPMALVAGYAVNELDAWAARDWGSRVPAALVMAAALSLGLYQTAVLNFGQYDNDAYPYVYAHTRRDVLRLVSEVERIAGLSGKGKDVRINISSPDYWPLPWYFNGYKGAGFSGQIPASYSEEVVVAKDSQEPQLQAPLGGKYVKIGQVYDLRPGVKLILYARRDAVQQ